uniref:Uncharacterized protein n=1 Tax=Rhizophora mucronata TaxID=61149 RepID=A0A2P2QKC0_RHIMU
MNPTQSLGLTKWQQRISVEKRRLEKRRLDMQSHVQKRNQLLVNPIKRLQLVKRHNYQ